VSPFNKTNQPLSVNEFFLRVDAELRRTAANLRRSADEVAGRQVTRAVLASLTTMSKATAPVMANGLQIDTDLILAPAFFFGQTIAAGNEKDEKAPTPSFFRRISLD